MEIENANKQKEEIKNSINPNISIINLNANEAETESKNSRHENNKVQSDGDKEISDKKDMKNIIQSLEVIVK